MSGGNPGKVTSVGSLPEKSRKVLNQTVIRAAFPDLNPAADTCTTIVAVLSACDRRNTHVRWAMKSTL